MHTILQTGKVVIDSDSGSVRRIPDLSPFRGSHASVNARPDEKRLWENRNYRRLKQCHNYYSP